MLTPIMSVCSSGEECQVGNLEAGIAKLPTLTNFNTTWVDHADNFPPHQVNICMLPTIAKIKNSPTIKKLLMVGSICGALVTIYNVGNIWHVMGWPRPVFTPEFFISVNDLQHKLRDFEIDYRQRAILYDQKSLRDIQRDIQQLQSRNAPMPEAILDLQSRLEESLRLNRDRLKILEDAAKNN